MRWEITVAVSAADQCAGQARRQPLQLALASDHSAMLERTAQSPKLDVVKKTKMRDDTADTGITTLTGPL
jgi:hypothetical protein